MKIYKIVTVACLLTFSILSGCYSGAITSTPTPSNTPDSDLQLTPEITVISTVASTDTSNIAQESDLIFAASNKIYLISVGCLDAKLPCLGASTKIFEMHGDGNIQSLSWSPDEKRIAFEYEDDIFLVSVGGDDVTNISNTPNTRDFGPIWSPDGTTLIYNSKSDENYIQLIRYENKSGEKDVFFDGKNHKNLFAFGGLTSWLSDGTRLVLSGWPVDDQNFSELFIYDLNTGNISQLTSSDSDIVGASSSLVSDVIVSTQIVMDGEIRTGSELVVISLLNGDINKVYGTGEDRINRPALDKLNKWIAFSLNGDIFIVNMDGSQLLQVTNTQDIKETSPAWGNVK